MTKVTAAILIKDDRILIAQRQAGDKLAHKWEFPGGKVEKNETPEQCLKREMKEEFGIDVTVGEYLAESVYHDDHGSIKLMAYRTFWKNGNLSPTAHEAVRWVSLKQLVDYDFAPADIPIVENLLCNEK